MDMNIFIIGPERVGKTVFATMFNNYIVNHPEYGLQFRARSKETKLYLANEWEILNNREWPSSTAGGKLVELKWEWEYSGSKSSIVLTDPPGQDIRKELAGDSEALGILDKIRAADILIILIDLYGHLEGSSEMRNENAWIVENIIQNVKPGQQVILAVTKADLWEKELPLNAWSNRDYVLEFICKKMPEFVQNGYKDIISKPNFNIFAFSAVSTIAKTSNNGSVERLPNLPLGSIGLDFATATVIKAWGNVHKLKVDREEKMAKEAAEEAERQRLIALKNEEAERIKNTQTNLIIAAVVSVVVLIAYFLWPSRCTKCGGYGTIEVNCRKCGGDGIIQRSGLRWDSDCDLCNRTGKVRETCPKCLGSKKE